MVLLRCSNGIEKKPDRADAFLKITEKSKGLFNKEARINNYKNSTANTENLKSSSVPYTHLTLPTILLV